MKVAVTDANIFIDLIHIGLIDELFLLNFELYATNEVCDELKSSEQDIILRFGKEGKLKIESLEEFQKGSITLTIPNQKLSYSDLSIFYVASYYNTIIISEDNLSRKIAIENNFEVHGILWVMDIMINLKIISPALACEKLEALLKFNKKMLMEESEAKIKSWKFLC